MKIKSGAVLSRIDLVKAIRMAGGTDEHGVSLRAANEIAKMLIESESFSVFEPKIHLEIHIKDPVPREYSERLITGVLNAVREAEGAPDGE